MGGVPPTSVSTRASKILVVEDDKDIGPLVARLMKPLGDVHAVTNGAEAWTALESGFLANVVVTDLMMPHVDGYTLMRRMKADDRFKAIPVIIMTARSTPQDVIQGIQAGARQYITKPFKNEELVEKVRRALKK